MLPIILGLSLFIVAVIITTTIKNIFKITYPTHPFIFCSLFVGLMIIIQVIHQVFNVTIVIFSIIIGLVYVGCMSFVRSSGLLKNVFGSSSLPEVHKEIAHPKLTGDVVKVFEVLLQDMSAWLTVFGLFSIVSDMYTVMILFTSLVFLLHLPGLRIFGKVYGTYFLLSSTLLAFSVPVLFSLDTIGFLVVFSLHLSCYVVMYVLLGFLGGRQINKQ